MKTLKSILALTITLLFIQSCGQKNSIDKKDIVYQGGQSGLSSYEINGRDTINVTDNSGFKQGHWVVFGFVIPGGKRPNETKEEMANRAQHVMLEEGMYKDNKKQGTWKYYNQDGTLKNTIEYKDDVPAQN